MKKNRIKCENFCLKGINDNYKKKQKQKFSRKKTGNIEYDFFSISNQTRFNEYYYPLRHWILFNNSSNKSQNQFFSAHFFSLSLCLNDN